MIPGRSDSSSKGGAEWRQPRVFAVWYWGADSNEWTVDYKTSCVCTLLFFLSLSLSHPWCPGYFLKRETNRKGKQKTTQMCPPSQSQTLPCLSAGLSSTNPSCASLERGNQGGKGNRYPVCCWRQSLNPKDEFMYSANIYWVSIMPGTVLVKI